MTEVELAGGGWLRSNRVLLLDIIRDKKVV